MSIPSESSDKYSVWEAENSMIMSWILGSMIPEVGNTFMLYQTAAKIWKATKEMYSKRDNISELYELETQLRDFKQGDQSVSQFFSSISQIWQQIDTLEVYQWTCNTDMQLFKTIRDTKRIFGFLSGLNNEFDGVRSRILGTKPLPAVNTVFSKIRQEESRLKVMMRANVSSVVSFESSALVSHVDHSEKGKEVFFASKKGGSGGYQKKYCKFCYRSGHVVEECYRRPGSKVKPPPFYRPHYHSNNNSSGKSDSGSSWRTYADSWRSAPKAALAETQPQEPSPSVFTPAQLDAILKVLGSQRAALQDSAPIQAQATMATGMQGKTNTWIIDSGATHHMTSNRNWLSSFMNVFLPKQVKIANGQGLDVLGHGDICLTKSLVLKEVLYVLV